MKFLWAVLLTTLCVAASLAHCIYTKLKKARRRSEDARPNGLCVISNPENAKIVAVHGLGTHPERTWEALPPRSKDSTEKTQPVHLLRHFLKEDFPEARILLHAHNSDWMINAPIKTARQIGEQLVAELTEHLSKHLCLPIVFIGHSFGGIIIKEALCAHGERSSDIIDNTHAIIFLGTPHLGSPLSVIGATVTAMTSVLGSSNTLLLMLGHRNDQLLDLERRFNSLIKLKDARRGKTELLAFSEAKPLTLGWLSFGL
ncbi:F-box/WD repeat-containing protein 9 [Verticillium nonalfalfae]|uniref:F-box/WD repeat-containing protein 9 n=1 Tax=Verticillium nonalfalfae TaxID=1051616 RepID=A0A3M9Y1I5_9PEZI|nr:F-box/WD repeat-containing protein 9 [Verticillium nonalfalfae]RNJ54369.1 F-box/WD repeat-containing protein 9 [Verticillium nonalfalfae]